ncbi:universal stress protein [Halohasta litorea]|uniref:Universal stress protein n=1 Tax=Halohasta litorea TaxID=869891 RepID=A0ABD6D7Z9_9EURY|nr:universal stress protein [Halohasta litorea]
MVVLVPYDGSQPAQQAVEYAIDNCGDQPIVLLRVIEFADGSLEAGVDLIKERLKESREEGAAELSEELLETLNDSTVDYDVETVVGKPAREIVEFAEANDISQIVIGSHGRTGASRVLLGSVAQTVVRRAPTPVTVVR